MRRSAIYISESYEIPEEQRSRLAASSEVFGHAQVAPDEMGGYFDYSDWQGLPISYQNFLGRWTFLYFGYSRCQGSCRLVAPNIAGAAAELRAKGLAGKAAFVDIEAQPIAPTRKTNGKITKHNHAANWPMRFAMSKMYHDYHGGLDIMTGNRAQLALATSHFHVMREHVPPRSNEQTMSINHSSIIYLIGPDTNVAGYGYHNLTRANLVALVEQLNRAERKPIDYTSVRNRFARAACGTV